MTGSANPSIHQPLSMARRCSTNLLPTRTHPSQAELFLPPGRENAPDVVTFPKPHLLHRWQQGDKCRPDLHCCCPVGSSTPPLPSLPAPLLTSKFTRCLHTPGVCAAACRGAKGALYPSAANNGSVLTNCKWFLWFPTSPGRRGFLTWVLVSITPTLLLWSLSTGCQCWWQLAPLEAAGSPCCCFAILTQHRRWERGAACPHLSKKAKLPAKRVTTSKAITPVGKRAQVFHRTGKNNISYRGFFLNEPIKIHLIELSKFLLHFYV